MTIRQFIERTIEGGYALLIPWLKDLLKLLVAFVLFIVFYSLFLS